jgi:hypothetical protein
VTDGTGAPATGAQVSINDGEETTTAVSKDGSYRFTEVDAGEYTVEVSGENYATQTVSVEVTPGQTTTQDIEVTQNQPDQPVIAEDDVEISINNNFADKDGQGVLETLFETAEDTIPLPNTGPEEQQSYIDDDVRVEIDGASQRDIERVSLTFEARGETFGGGEKGRIPYQGGDVYRAENLRITSPTQVKVTQFKRLMTIVSSFAPGSAASIESGIEQDLESYPDVSIVAVNIQFADGSTKQIETNKQLPRFTDTCQDSLFSMDLRTYPDPDCTFSNQDQDAVTVLSPARIVIEDSQGRQTGRIRRNGEYQSVNEIPGSFYSGNQTHEFVLVPSDGNYSINVVGTDEGDATIIVDNLTKRQNRTMIESTTYQNVSVKNGTTATTDFTNQSLTVADGNQTQTISPDTQSVVSPTPEPICSECNTPQDPDNDGEYEDINGNGVVGFGDVTTLFDNLRAEAVTENTPAYDYNDNDVVGFGDVIYLFEEI